jgi:hypothetical protein
LRLRELAGDGYNHIFFLLVFSGLVVMLSFLHASAEKCDLLNPNACGLYDCGGNSWSPDETEGNGDNLSLRSGQVNMIGSSKVCVRVRGPGLVKFAWKVDKAAQSLGILSFLVDNSPARVCDSQVWAPVSHSLRDDKDYVISWQFQKIKSYPVDEGAGWVDDLDINARNLSMIPIISSQGLSEPLENNITSANYSNQSLINRIDDNQVDGHCCDCVTRKNEIDKIEKSIEHSVLQSQIIVPPPNITINIELNPTTNISVNIPSSSSSNETNLSDVPIIKPRDVFVSRNNCEYSKCYDSIREAVNAVGDGGNVTIYSGTYNESVVIDKSLHLVGKNNATTKLIVKDHNGVNISCRDAIVSLENLSIVNEYSTCRKSIGVDVLSPGVNFSLLNCRIIDFAIGVKIKNPKSFIATNNYISSSLEPDNECTFRSRYHPRERHNFTAGIWLESSCNERIEMLGNTLDLKQIRTSLMDTYGIIHKGFDRCYSERNGLWGNEANNMINSSCKILFERYGASPECSCTEDQQC